MQKITRELLVEDSPGYPIPENRDYDLVSAENNLPSDSLIFDDVLDMDQSFALEVENKSPIDIDNQSQTVTKVYTPTVARDEELKFVDNYFAYYHTIYPILHQDSFRSVQVGQPAPLHWPVLTNMVLAFGAWLSPDAHHNLDKVYFARAEEYFEKSFMKGPANLTLVQALILLSEFAQKQGSPEKSRRYIGSAVQTSVALNLQMEPQDPKSTELDKEVCRRVWWSVYCAESCSAKIYGRPLSLPEDALMTVKPVSNIRENVRLSSFHSAVHFY